MLVPASGLRKAWTRSSRGSWPSAALRLRTTATRAGAVRFLLEAPGFGQPTVAVFEFVEWFDKTAQGWLRVRYKFKYRPAASRKAHHQHASWGFHQHCEPPGRVSTDHYQDDERLIMQTVDAFTQLYASGQPIQCVGLRKLGSRRTRADSEESVST